LLAAPSLPTKDVLNAKLQLIAKEKKWNFAIEETAKPDKEWLVMMLSTYLPEDEIFKKSYRAPPEVEKRGRENNTIPS
jgi:hypothetical protein